MLDEGAKIQYHKVIRSQAAGECRVPRPESFGRVHGAEITVAAR